MLHLIFFQSYVNQILTELINAHTDNRCLLRQKTGRSHARQCVCLEAEHLIFVIEQTIEGRFVSPLVLGNKLSIHPITIMFILLTAGSLYGVWGVLLGIPIYASVKVIVKEIFDWYRSVSNLYQDDIEIKGQKYDVK